MTFSIRREGAQHATVARIVETARGDEIRGKHLLAIRNEKGEVVIKLRDEYLIITEEDRA